MLDFHYICILPDRKILNVKVKAVVKRLASETSWLFCCTCLVKITLAKILDLTPILSLFIPLRVKRHYMMLFMFSHLNNGQLKEDAGDGSNA